MASANDLPSSSDQGELKGPYDDLFTDSFSPSFTSSTHQATNNNNKSDLLTLNEYDETLALFPDEADWDPTPVAEFGTNPLPDLKQFQYPCLELMSAIHQHSATTSGGTLDPTPLPSSAGGTQHELLHHYARTVSSTSVTSSSSANNSSSFSGDTAPQNKQSVSNGNVPFLNFPNATFALPTAAQLIAMSLASMAQPQAPTVHQVASFQASNSHQGRQTSFQNQVRELEKAVSLVQPNDVFPIQVPVPIHNSWAPSTSTTEPSYSLAAAPISTVPALSTTKRGKAKKAAKIIAKKPKMAVTAAAAGSNMPIKPLSTYNFFFRWERKRILQNVHDTNGPLYWNWDEDFRRQVLEAHWAEDRTTKRKHRKSHGMISFAELSKRVSATWRTLPDSAKEVFRDIAARDLIHYNLKMSKVEPVAKVAKETNREPANETSTDETMEHV